MTIPFSLDDHACEVVIAPFHDPHISPDIPRRLEPLHAKGVELAQTWCNLKVVWQQAERDEPACRLTVDTPHKLGRFDHIIVCVVLTPMTSVQVEACVDGRWQLGETVRGRDQRSDIALPVTGERLDAVRLTFIAHAELRQHAMVSWVGLGDGKRQSAVTGEPVRYDDQWAGLIKPSADWGDVRFERGLFFDVSDLPMLREKAKLPGWRACVDRLRSKALRAMQRRPEDEIGRFIPWSDTRYLREREQGRWPLFAEAQSLAVVGVLDDDRAMMRHALRYLMSLCHTGHWCASAEQRLTGSTWNQRAFTEELTASSVALVYDLLGFALTDRARDLVLTSLWEKALAYIEYDLMKHAYMHAMNQGAWFCRARILAGLMLERAWPHVGDYVDRAAADLKRILDAYIQPDGGADEGVGYYTLTLSHVLSGAFAWGRLRGRDTKELLPANLAHSDAYLSVLSAVRPGRVLLDGDNSTDRIINDAPALMARLYPDSLWSDILAETVTFDMDGTYFGQYQNYGEVAFIVGPVDVPPARSIVPTFARLGSTGHLTSLRPVGEQSVRIHLSGAKANPSHAHLDRGALTLEVGGESMLIDRGMKRYDRPSAMLMNTSQLHNVLTPVNEEGLYPSQVLPHTPVIAEGSGDEQRLAAQVDLAAVWPTWMEACERRLTSDEPTSLEVRDLGRLKRDGRVAFHLHALAPFEIDGDVAVCTWQGYTVRIALPWAESVTAYEHDRDFADRPVYHLVATSPVLRQFDLASTLRIIAGD